MARALINERQLDINDVGIGNYAMQVSKSFKKNNFSNYISSSNIILSEKYNPVDNSKLGSFYKHSETGNNGIGSLLNTEFASKETTHRNSPAVRSMDHPIIRTKAASALEL